MTSRSRLEVRGVEPTFAGPIAAIMVHGGTSVRGRLYRVQCPCTRCDPPVRKWWLQNSDLCLRQAKVHTYQHETIRRKCGVMIRRKMSRRLGV